MKVTVRPKVGATMCERVAAAHHGIGLSPEPREQREWEEHAGRDARTVFLMLSAGALTRYRAADFQLCWALMTPASSK